LSPPAKDGTVRQPIMKYQYRKDLLNTIMANVDVGTFKGDEFYVPLKTVEGQSKTEVEVQPFNTIQDRKNKMINKYSQK
jgi:hypothetical protein